MWTVQRLFRPLEGMDYPSLFPPGIHSLDDAELSTNLVDAFSTSATRATLFDGFKSFVLALRKVNVRFEIWLDGSFCTQKLNPNDIDLVVFANPAELDVLDSAEQKYLAGLLDRTTARRSFGCDVLFAKSTDANMRSYWRGWYGFDRSERPKGILTILVQP